MSRENFLPPKIDSLEKAKDGQGFNHEIPMDRNWEKVLDTIHNILLQQWYYVAIASNTHGGIFNSASTKKINIVRKKRAVPSDLQTILQLKMKTFENLKGKIKEKSAVTGDKDVWHFSSKWEEFPRGTNIIEIYQRPMINLFSTEILYRKAFIILDGKLSIDHQNQTMMTINKVLKDKKYSKQVLKNIKKEPVVESKVKVRTSSIYEGRPPAELVLMLRSNFKANIRTVSIDEKTAINLYFNKLKKAGEYTTEHKELENKMNYHFDRDFKT